MRLKRVRKPDEQTQKRWAAVRDVRNFFSLASMTIAALTNGTGESLSVIPSIVSPHLTFNIDETTLLIGDDGDTCVYAPADQDHVYQVSSSSSMPMRIVLIACEAASGSTTPFCFLVDWPALPEDSIHSISFTISKSIAQPEFEQLYVGCKHARHEWSCVFQMVGRDFLATCYHGALAPCITLCRHSQYRV